MQARRILPWPHQRNHAVPRDDAYVYALTLQPSQIYPSSEHPGQWHAQVVDWLNRRNRVFCSISLKHGVNRPYAAYGALLEDENVG